MKYQDYKPKANQSEYRPNTDILFVPSAVSTNRKLMITKPKPKRRRVNYEKKILNDQFLFSV